MFPLEPMIDSQGESFASSMTELIIVELRRMNPSLSVVTPEFTTERARKAKGKLSQCRDVSADYMLVGTVSEADGKMRIIVRLLKRRTQACVWAESYTQPKEDLFAHQAEISRKIASSIIQSIPISIRPSHLGAVPASVYETYLQACSLRSRLSEDALDRCIRMLEGVVRESPRFAPAWVALANAHCMAARSGIAPSGKAFPQVKTCMDKALAIEDLTEAKTAQAYYHFFYEHDWDAAEASLLRALALDARYPLAVGGYAQLLAALGRHNQAVFLMRQACESGSIRKLLGNYVRVGVVLCRKLRSIARAIEEGDGVGLFAVDWAHERGNGIGEIRGGARGRGRIPPRPGILGQLLFGEGSRGVWACTFGG